MCLHYVNTDKIQDKIKATIPEDGLKVYKVVEVRDGKRYPLFQCCFIEFEEGMNEARILAHIVAYRGDYYQAGFHFWLTKEAAKESCQCLCKQSKSDKFKVIECIVKKKWITAIGQNEIWPLRLRRAIVAKKAIFPVFSEYE